MRVGFIIDLLMRLSSAVPVHWHAGARARSGQLAAGVSGSVCSARGGRVTGWRAGGRLSAARRVHELLRSPAETGRSVRSRAHDGEVLQPVEARQTVIKTHSAARVLLILRMQQHPFLLELLGDLWTRQHGHRDRDTITFSLNRIIGFRIKSPRKKTCALHLSVLKKTTTTTKT